MPVLPQAQDPVEAQVGVPGNQVQEISVLVTGFGALPSTLTVEIPAKSQGGGQEDLKKVKVNLIVYAPLAVSYHQVSEILPSLLSTHRPDLTLNVGLAGNRNYFAPEYSAPDTGFTYPDVDGEVYGKDLPYGKLHTTLDYDTMAEEWIGSASAISVPRDKDEVRSLLGSVYDYLTGGGGDLRPKCKKSDDVGSYLCGFSYHTSLQYYLEQSGSSPGAGDDSVATNNTKGKGTAGGPAIFLHVPLLRTAAEITMGAKVAEELIKSMVRSFLADSQ